MKDILRKLFWDVKIENIDLGAHAKQIIERALEYGDAKTIGWLKKTYPREEIIKILKASRNLSPKSANFWALIFSVSEREILCLNKSYRKKVAAFWPH